jgi:hypothetical protein
MTLSSSPIYAVRLVDVRSSCMIHLGGVAGVMYFVTSLKFGVAWLGGRWIRFMARLMECAWGGSTCVVFSVCSRVLVVKCWG